MSKFFDQSSSSESETESENEEQIIDAKKKQQKMFFDSDEEEKKTVRIVLPEKAKRLEEINSLVRQLKNAKKIRDVVKSLQTFEEMTKTYEKCKKIVDKEGHFKQFVRAISEYETFIDELWSDSAWRKSANKQNAGALSKSRQRIRRYNKEYEEEITDFKANPDNYPEEEKVKLEKSEDEKSASEDESDSDEESDSDDSDSDSDDDDDGTAAAKRRRAKAAAKKAAAKDSDDSDDDDDSDDWSMSESETSSDESGEEFDQENIWKKFLRNDDKPDKDVHKKDKPKKVKKTRSSNRGDGDYDDEKKSKKEGAEGSEKPKLFPKDEEITHEKVVAKLNEICSTRGRKGTDRFEQIELIAELRNIAKTAGLGAAIDVKILFNQIAINFDYNPRKHKCMKTPNWNMTLKMLDEILEILMSNETIELSASVAEDNENVSDATTTPVHYRIRGCVLTMSDRMCEEFVKILQQCDAHGSEYVERLKDEPRVAALIDRLQTYIERKADTQEICRVYLRKVENVYYKYERNKETAVVGQELVDRLCKYIYSHDSTDRLRTKAMLCHIYHNALHDRWFEARDLILMSHLQESIDNADVPLQILYNRTMVQVGLCAFRVGNIKEAHAALLDIQVGNRAKELLAQGMMLQRNVEKTKEQETKERQRLIPFHMHINLELLECIYLVSAMLIEIPYMSSRDYETRKRLISKQFHYQLKFSERQPVVGPPENMREHVVAASRAMKNGDWRGCVGFLVNEKMNTKVWDLMAQSDSVKVMLTEKVKVESLRTYLFRFSGVYESISIESLAATFELERPHVYSTISKMIINEELMASLDEPTQTVVMHRTEPTKLQTLSMQLSEKINNLMDQTERTIQVKGGEMGNFLARGNQGGPQGQHNNQNRDGRDNRDKSNWKGHGNKRGGGHHGGNRHHNNNYHGNRDRDHHNRDNRENREHHHNRGENRESQRNER